MKTEKIQSDQLYNFDDPYDVNEKLQPVVAEIDWPRGDAIAAFLKEMGGMVAFVGRQYRIEVDDKEYFIDILLYHRKLKCLIAVELKISEFEPEFVGKMQFYLATLDVQEKAFGENRAIGIILCKTKSKTIVEYALLESNKPIGVATYTVTKKLPKELRDQLPTLEQIEKLIDKIE